MKYRPTFPALVVSFAALCAFPYGAQATTVGFVEITSEVYTGNAPVEGAPAPLSSPAPVNFIQGITGSVTDVNLSPYAFNTNGTTNTPYNVIDAGSPGSLGSAVYNVGATTFQLLWGSPDSYNQVAFYTGAAGGGSQLITVTLAALPTLSGDYYTGQDLSCGCTGTFFDLVTFTLVTGPGGPTDIGSVVLSDTGQAAFEFGVSQTPLPAALPLFAGGLGLVGLLAQRRKRRGPVAA